MTYSEEFTRLMLKRLAKPYCKHCYERGTVGNRPKTTIPVACQCAVQNIVKYGRLRKPSPTQQFHEYKSKGGIRT